MSAVKPLGELTNQELADTYLQYVILHQQANVEKRWNLTAQREAIAELHDALRAEIERRGMAWQVGLRGEVWLEPKTSEAQS